MKERLCRCTRGDVFFCLSFASSLVLSHPSQHLLILPSLPFPPLPSSLVESFLSVVSSPPGSPQQPQPLPPQPLQPPPPPQQPPPPPPPPPPSAVGGCNGGVADTVPLRSPQTHPRHQQHLRYPPPPKQPPVPRAHARKPPPTSA
ncbi:hypothetical protein E2C01_013409 [Portunus trituberculatus]|uniref:Uncharacterized protein n=1 Tax=Portunus trituberculatus TaxID=210409 RepID=A0A5B7DH92_PORTR|nr:hypothetical protein [Portunus trituberculatus]